MIIFRPPLLMEEYFTKLGGLPEFGWYFLNLDGFLNFGGFPNGLIGVLKKTCKNKFIKLKNLPIICRRQPCEARAHSPFPSID